MRGGVVLGVVSGVCLCFNISAQYVENPSGGDCEKANFANIKNKTCKNGYWRR